MRKNATNNTHKSISLVTKNMFFCLLKIIYASTKASGKCARKKINVNIKILYRKY